MPTTKIMYPKINPTRQDQKVSKTQLDGSVVVFESKNIKNHI